MKLKLSLAAALAAGLAFGSAQAQTKWDMPTPYADSNFHTKNVRQFADDVKAASGGKMEIVVHSNASLIKHPEIKRAVQTGQVNIAGNGLLSWQTGIQFSLLTPTPSSRRITAPRRNCCASRVLMLKSAWTRRASKCCMRCHGRRRASTPRNRSTALPT